jgi:hypothetical protein
MATPPSGRTHHAKRYFCAARLGCGDPVVLGKERRWVVLAILPSLSPTLPTFLRQRRSKRHGGAKAMREGKAAMPVADVGVGVAHAAANQQQPVSYSAMQGEGFCLG